MGQVFEVHPTHPQLRILSMVVRCLQQGGVIAYPTDSCYALGCQVGDKAAMQRIRQLRQLTEKHPFTLLCRDLSELSKYARVSNPVFRLLRAHTPGPYTFLLPATRELPKRLQHPKRRVIGLRVPGHRLLRMLLELIDAPLLSSSLILPGDTEPLCDPEAIAATLVSVVDMVLLTGPGQPAMTSVIDLTEAPRVIREGLGPVEPFLEGGW